MKIAVQGCAHGDLDKIYATLKHIEQVENIKIDLLICCGDFQAVRNAEDMQTIACPPKYREMKDFWKYYSGKVEAPYLTLFIGGNHEASSHLWELYHGGWAAPKMYFLGFSGVIKFGDLRIAGLSGIYKPQHYSLGYFEKCPYNENDIRSIYHIREYEVEKILSIKDKIDIFLTHDWPTGIANFGDCQKLFSQKPFLKAEIESNLLGNPAGEKVLKILKPNYWFSAHMHVKFSALVPHGENDCTKFLALDKCLPGRDFLQILDFPEPKNNKEKVFYYDEEWLSIVKSFSQFFPLSRFRPKIQINMDELITKNKIFIKNIFENKEKRIPDNFCTTVTSFSDENNDNNKNKNSSKNMRNPQTEYLCKMLEINYCSKKINNGDGDMRYGTIEKNKKLKIDQDDNEIEINDIDDNDNDDHDDENNNNNNVFN